MSHLRKAADSYLTLRRGLGFKLGRTETRLRQFLAFMEAKRTTRITIALALEFALQATQWDPKTIAQRLSVVRGFARHHRATEPATKIPPLGLMSGGSLRAQPYLYTEAEILRLLKGAQEYPLWNRFPGPWELRCELAYSDKVFDKPTPNGFPNCPNFRRHRTRCLYQRRFSCEPNGSGARPPGRSIDPA